MNYSYCGDRFPDTIITEKNQLGLTFETSLRNSAKGFSARVTLLNGMYMQSKNCEIALSLLKNFEIYGFLSWSHRK